MRRAEWQAGSKEGGASWTPLGIQSVLIWQLDLAGVKTVGFHDRKAIGLSIFHKPFSFPAGPFMHPGDSNTGGRHEETSLDINPYLSSPFLNGMGQDSWFWPPSQPLPLPIPFSWIPYAPVVRQISHKGAAKDQDDREAKEEDNPHVPDIHNRVVVVAMGVWVLWNKKKRSMRASYHSTKPYAGPAWAGLQFHLGPILPPSLNSSLSVLRTCQAPSHHGAFALVVLFAWKVFSPNLIMTLSASSIQSFGLIITSHKRHSLVTSGIKLNYRKLPFSYI